MRVEIDDRSGFCFGVVRAISMAETCMAKTESVGPAEGSLQFEPVCRLVSLGDIVHNGAEVARLEALGLEVVPENEPLERLRGRTVLIRAHGEPPATYTAAGEHGITLIDATCPVVAALQRTVAKEYAEMERKGGQVAIFGRKGHAEVRGLIGQVEGRVVVVEGEDDLDLLDFGRPICFLAQTTSSLSEFRRLGEEIKRRMEQVRASQPVRRGEPQLRIRDTVCRRVAGLESHLAGFARRHDVVIFVAGAKSSNGKVLFKAVHRVNPDSHKIESAEELRSEWFDGKGSVGVCGATSTPKWLMEQVAEKIRTL